MSKFTVVPAGLTASPPEGWEFDSGVQPQGVPRSGTYALFADDGSVRAVAANSGAARMPLGSRFILRKVFVPKKGNLYQFSDSPDFSTTPSHVLVFGGMEGDRFLDSSGTHWAHCRHIPKELIGA